VTCPSRAEMAALMNDSDGNAIIRVELSGPAPSAYVKPGISINGGLQRRPWGMHSFLAAPGRVVVEVTRPWLLGSNGGKARIEVDAAADEVVCLFYTQGPFSFSDGTLTRVPPSK
jgi:hypothetical protein